ncbi:TolB-like 6-bladed beta-propeller domain-containing protein, partial [Bacteroides acidifaciens]|nr:TolB-like 6-bladed beta-propeller domain-containing protein [Bacteroides acidifaciens]
MQNDTKKAMSAVLLTLLKYLIISDLFVISCRRFSPFFTSHFPKEKELRGEVIELDTALFRYPFRIRIEGDKAIVMDLHGSDCYGHLFQY